MKTQNIHKEQYDALDHLGETIAQAPHEVPQALSRLARTDYPGTARLRELLAEEDDLDLLAQEVEERKYEMERQYPFVAVYP